ncbi:hypothetical protein ACWDB3_05120 [Streptomyces bacillaris]
MAGVFGAGAGAGSGAAGEAPGVLVTIRCPGVDAGDAVGPVAVVVSAGRRWSTGMAAES